jgi:ATP-dependent helicase IRC3
MPLRPYQEEALNAIELNLEQGVNRQVVVLPTGSGKTILFANIRKRLALKKRSLILAHREELVEQARDKIQKWNPELRIGIEKAEHTCSDDDDVVVASVPTIGKAGSPRLLKLRPDEFDCIITDECHHGTATSYKAIYDHFGFGKGQNGDGRLLLGVTATPNRGDGQGLVQVFDKVVYSYSMLDAIRDGWLAPPRGYRIRTDTKLDAVHTLAGDFQQAELASAVNNDRRNSLIAQKWSELVGERSTIVFTVDINHAKRLAESYRGLAVKADAIWGNDPDRAEKLAAHRRGDIQVLMNCGVLTEGYDDWRVGCIVLARPTKSQLLFTQMVGRGARIEDGIGNLHEWLVSGNATAKEDFLVLDVADNTTRHSLVSLSSLFGLPAQMDLKGKKINEAVDKLEAVSMKHLDTDLSKCQDIDRLEAYAEEVDLFTGKFVDEVEANSELQWHKTPQGNYVILLPWRERVSICKDWLGHWFIKGTVEGTKFEAETKHLDAAFHIADQRIKQLGSRFMNGLRRQSNAPWRDAPATPEQIKTLKWQLDKMKKPYPDFSKLSMSSAIALLNKLFTGGV